MAPHQARFAAAAAAPRWAVQSWAACCAGCSRRHAPICWLGSIQPTTRPCCRWQATSTWFGASISSASSSTIPTCSTGSPRTAARAIFTPWFLTEGACKAPGGLFRVRLLARADYILDLEISGLRIRSLRHRRSRNARPGPGLGRGRHNLTHLDRDLVAPGLRGISIRSIGPGHRPAVSRRRRSSTIS